MPVAFGDPVAFMPLWSLAVSVAAAPPMLPVPVVPAPVGELMSWLVPLGVSVLIGVLPRVLLFLVVPAGAVDKSSLSRVAL